MPEHLIHITVTDPAAVGGDGVGRGGVRSPKTNEENEIKEDDGRRK